MYNYNQRQRQAYSNPTLLGIPERVESALCYLFGWITGIIFLLIERRNPTVQRHAKQSIMILGGLSLLGWIAGWLEHIPLLGLAFAIIGGIIGLVWIISWIGLIVLALVNPNKTLFLGSRWERYF